MTQEMLMNEENLSNLAAIGEMYPSLYSPECYPEEAERAGHASAQRFCIQKACATTSRREDGGFFDSAQNDNVLQ